MIDYLFHGGINIPQLWIECQR